MTAADLDFPIRHLEVTPTLGDKSAEFSFFFTNRGRAPITIQNIVTGCGCVVARMDKKTFAPGESGVVPVVYAIGGLYGTQQKTIRLFTSDAEHPITALEVVVKLPEGAALTPRIVQWPLHGPATAQSVEVRIPKDATWHIVKASDHTDTFVPTLAASEEPGKLLLTVTPRQTERAVTGVEAISKTAWRLLTG